MHYYRADVLEETFTRFYRVLDVIKISRLSQVADGDHGPRKQRWNMLSKIVQFATGISATLQVVCIGSRYYIILYFALKYCLFQ